MSIQWNLNVSPINNTITAQTDDNNKRILLLPNLSANIPQKGTTRAELAMKIAFRIPICMLLNPIPSRCRL